MAGYLAQFPEENAKFSPTYAQLVNARADWMHSYKALMEVEGRLAVGQWDTAAINLVHSGEELVNVISEARNSVKDTDWTFLLKNVAYHAATAVTAVPRYTVTGLLSLGKAGVEVGVEQAGEVLTVVAAEVGEVGRAVATEARETLGVLGLSPTKLLLIVGAIGAGYLMLLKGK
jgi:hypothetical protein